MSYGVGLGAIRGSLVARSVTNTHRVKRYCRVVSYFFFSTLPTCARAQVGNFFLHAAAPARRWAIFFSPCCPHGSLPEFTWPRCPRGSLLLPRPSLPGRLAARCPRGWLSPESPPGRALASRPRSSLVHLTTRTCSPLGRLATHARPRGRVRLPSACHVAIAHLRARRWAEEQTSKGKTNRKNTG